MSDCGWISVDDYLPEPNVWVQVFEDDNENAQDAYLDAIMRNGVSFSEYA